MIHIIMVYRTASNILNLRYGDNLLVMTLHLQHTKYNEVTEPTYPLPLRH